MSHSGIELPNCRAGGDAQARVAMRRVESGRNRGNACRVLRTEARLAGLLHAELSMLTMRDMLVARGMLVGRLPTSESSSDC